MDTRIMAAVYAKIKNTYENEKERKFLCFPTGFQFRFSTADLPALTNMRLEGEQFDTSINTMYEFSRIVNSPVRGITSSGVETDELLWDPYSEILSTAEIAEISENTSSFNRYNEAVNFLYTFNDDSRAANDTLLTYNKYRDQYFKQWEEYNNVKLAQTKITTEQGALQAARAVKASKEKLDDIEHEWIVVGNKTKVEECLNTITELSKAHPTILWNEMKQGFDEQSDFLTCNTKGLFAPSYIFPSTFMDEKWDTITFDADDLETYFDKAPSALKQLTLGRQQENIKSISLEYRSVRVERPWFNGAVFKSDLWRFPNTMKKEPIAYSDEPSLGRYPAYITALLLYRNLQIVYKSGMQAVESSEGKDTAAVLAYICKRLTDCPSPNPNAKWHNGYADGRLQLCQSHGGKFIARALGRQIGSCYLPLGTEVECMAEPDTANDYVINCWKRNDTDTSCNNYHYRFKIASPKEEVEVVWKKGTKIPPSSYELSPDKKILFKWKGCEAYIDMDTISELLTVTTISAEAFCDNKCLQHIRIGQNVSVIERGAFMDCEALNMVEIPATATSIDRTAFGKRSTMTVPHFTVDGDNPVYVANEGNLMERKHISNTFVLRCMHCGFPIFFTKQPDITVCPYCHKQLDAKKKEEQMVIQPDFHVPLKIREAELKSILKHHFKHKFFVLKDYKQTVFDHAEFSSIYIPQWFFGVITSSEYIGLKGIDQQQTQPSAESQEKAGKEIKYNECSGTHGMMFKDIVIPASKFNVKIDTNVTKIPFRAELYSSSSLFELYGCNHVEGTKALKNQIDTEIKDAIKNEIGGIEPKIKTIKTAYTNVDSSLALYPIWSSLFTYNGKDYRIIVDGYTGKVSMQSPKDKVKIYVTIAIVLATISAIVLCCIL